MRRLLGATAVLAALLLAGPSRAAEISRVATSGEPGSAFELDVGVRWERSQERATITRERAAATSGTPGALGDPDLLRYTRTRNSVVPRLAVGLWRDLELHAELPYVLEDDQTYRYGNRYGKPTGGAGESSIEQNPYDADGLTTTGTCIPGPCPLLSAPLFSASPQSTVYHGGRTGDLAVGLAWAVFNDRKDDTKPTWVLGMDVTAPTATAYEPARDRGATDWASPYAVPARPGPIGERIWKWDLYTVLSRRLGAFDPYVKAHYTAMFKSSSTYSNCTAARAAPDTPPPGVVRQFNSQAVANCQSWGSEAGAQLPWMAGLTFGTEVVAYEDAAEGQRLAFDFRVHGDYTSPQRFFNELSDASGRIHKTEGFLEMGGLAGIYFDATRVVQFKATASISTRTAHWLTGESLGRNGTTPAVGPDGITTDPSLMNPNFDWRYDAPGHRFRISEVAIFDVSVAGVVRF